MPHCIEPGNDCYALEIEKLKRGAIGAFQQSYRLFYPVLHALIAERPIGDRQRAEMIQQAFIKCWMASRKISSADYVEGFLQIAVLSTPHNNILSSLPLLDHQDQILRQLLSSDIRQGITRHQLYTYLQDLPAQEKEGMRLVFESHYMKRSTPAAIAEAYGMGVETVAAKLKLAYQSLHLILSMEPCN